MKDARNVTARRTFRVRKANKPKPKKDTGASQNSVNTAGANANGKSGKTLIYFHIWKCLLLSYHVTYTTLHLS